MKQQYYHYFETMLPNLQKNSNFHNSTSCRIFDEVQLARIYISHSRRRSQPSKSTMKTTEKSCNHQFERSYIIPRVTYVEKPNRMLLNPLVSSQLTGSSYLSEKSDGTDSTYVENCQGLRKCSNERTVYPSPDILAREHLRRKFNGWASTL